MDVSSFQNHNPFSGYKTVSRFTMIAEDIIMKIEAAKVYGDEEYGKRVSVLMISLLQSNFSVYKFLHFTIFTFSDAAFEIQALLTDLSLWVLHCGQRLGHLFPGHHLYLLGHTCPVYTNCGKLKKRLKPFSNVSNIWYVWKILDIVAHLLHPALQCKITPI